MENRPKFEDITSFENFNKYYWYRDELSKICRSLKIEHRGTKQELMNNIKKYFSGKLIKKKVSKKYIKKTHNISINTPLLECNFSFNSKFRHYFSKITGVISFKFTADMATAWRKVKNENDKNFTIQNMLDIYYGKSNYAKYDNSMCQWNQFVKDFCEDEKSFLYSNKLKVASILWKEIRDSKKEKVYHKELLDKYSEKIKDYQK
ncbi:SAP domain-containing protein [Oceanotoga sp. DSM 15011]|nr:SAP domain-containing protein [Oceanotoga sp. DSM 15011]UYP00345.1 SAP domain-containing protein [Oceanotoga sp. DSM 15011]